jgi:hypothetical protein
VVGTLLEKQASDDFKVTNWFALALADNVKVIFHYKKDY